MDIITQTLFTTFLNWALTQWRIETMTILIMIAAVYFIRKYKIKLTNLEIGLSFLCLILLYCNMFYFTVYNQQQQTIKEYQNAITHYEEKLDIVYKDLELTRILIEARKNNYTEKQLIEALDKYFEKI